MKCRRCGRVAHDGPCVFSPGKSSPEKIRDEMTNIKGRLTTVEKNRKP